MEVRATAQGYLDLKIRNPGDVFTIQSEQEFADVWMEKIGGSAKPAKPVSVAKKPSKEVFDAPAEKSAGTKEDVI